MTPATPAQAEADAFFANERPMGRVADAVAWTALTPMLDRMERDLVAFRAQVDAATNSYTTGVKNDAR